VAQADLEDRRRPGDRPTIDRDRHVGVEPHEVGQIAQRRVRSHDDVDSLTPYAEGERRGGSIVERTLGARF
jgi:hypothetical protein